MSKKEGPKIGELLQDDHAGRGGSYEVVGGKRVLRHRTRTKDEIAAEKKSNAAADEVKEMGDAD